MRLLFPNLYTTAWITLSVFSQWLYMSVWIACWLLPSYVLLIMLHIIAVLSKGHMQVIVSFILYRLQQYTTYKKCMETVFLFQWLMAYYVVCFRPTILFQEYLY
jgi:hypothetical protein